MTTKDKVIKSLKDGKSLETISLEEFKTSSTACINNFLHKNNINPAHYSDRYLYMDKTWLKEKLEEYKTPNRIANAFDMPRTSITRWAEKFGLYSTSFSRKPKNKINEEYFHKVNTSEKAYWLGFIMADGNVYKYKDETGKIQFDIKIHQDDYGHLLKLARAIDFPEDKVQKGSRYRNETETFFCSLRSYNKKFVDGLLKHEIIPNKTEHKKIPTLLNKKFYPDFIRGFWDGDGSIGTSTGIFCCLCKEGLLQIKKYLEENKIEVTFGNVKLKSERPAWRITVRRKTLLKFLNLIYPKNCLSLDRKMEIVNAIRSSLEEKQEKNKDNCGDISKRKSAAVGATAREVQRLFHGSR
jgi:hypothetical protein